MKPTNYVKLFICAFRRYDDGTAVTRSLSEKPGGNEHTHVTTWIFPFVDELEGDGRRALAQAEAKCESVAAEYALPLNRFCFAVWRPSSLDLDSVLSADESEAA